MNLKISFTIHWSVLLQTGVFLYYFLLIPDSNCLRNVRMVAPKYMRRGEDVKLVCNYDIESGSLYAIKWYRNGKEFYRYVPKEVPPQQVFQQEEFHEGSTTGILINVTHSNDHVVLLQTVSFDISGKYKCVVSAETTFETLEAVQEINVVAIGYESPMLFMDRESYHVGETGKANCSMEKTSPIPNITWFINNQVGDKEMIQTQITPRKGDMKMFNLYSTLQFNISDFLPFQLKCKIEMYDVYSETSSVLIQPKPRPVVTVSYYGNNHPESSVLRSNSMNQTATKKYLQGLLSKSSLGTNLGFTNKCQQLLAYTILISLHSLI